MDCSIIHDTILSEKMFESIRKNGLLIPSHIDEELKKDIDIFRQQKLKIAHGLVRQINYIFDSMAPNDARVLRSDSIYAHLYHAERTLEYAGTNASAFQIDRCLKGYVSDQMLNGILHLLRKEKIDLLSDEKIPPQIIPHVQECAREYWPTVIPLEEFLTQYEYAPHELSQLNWNLKNHKMTSKGFSPCYSYPEVMYGINIPFDKMKVIAKNIVSQQLT